MIKKSVLSKNTLISNILKSIIFKAFYYKHQGVLTPKIVTAPTLPSLQEITDKAIGATGRFIEILSEPLYLVSSLAVISIMGIMIFIVIRRKKILGFK